MEVDWTELSSTLSYSLLLQCDTRTHEAKLGTRRSKIYKVFLLLASLITLMFSKFLNNTKHQYVIIFKIILSIKIFI